MESFTKELKQWAETIHKTWQEIAENEKQMMRTEKVKIFEIKLEQLLTLLKDDGRIVEVEKLSQNANELYQLWNELIRSEGQSEQREKKCSDRRSCSSTVTISI